MQHIPMYLKHISHVLNTPGDTECSKAQASFGSPLTSIGQTAESELLTPVRGRDERSQVRCLGPSRRRCLQGVPSTSLLCLAPPPSQQPCLQLCSHSWETGGHKMSLSREGPRVAQPKGHTAGLSPVVLLIYESLLGTWPRL